MNRSILPACPSLATASFAGQEFVKIHHPLYYPVGGHITEVLRYRRTNQLCGRRLLALCWGVIVRVLFDLRVRDIDCAFKLFRRDVIDTVPIASIGAFVNTEILVRAVHAGFRIHQVEVSHRPRRHGRQSGAHPRVVLRAAVELATLFRELRTSRDPGTSGAVARGR